MCWAWAGELSGETLTRCQCSKALAEAARVPGRGHEMAECQAWLEETWSLRLLSLESSTLLLKF